MLSAGAARGTRNSKLGHPLDSQLGLREVEDAAAESSAQKVSLLTGSARPWRRTPLRSWLLRAHGFGSHRGRE